MRDRASPSTFHATRHVGPAQETREFVGWDWDLLVRVDADGAISVHLEHTISGELVPPGPNYHSHPVAEMDRLRAVVRGG